MKTEILSTQLDMLKKQHTEALAANNMKEAVRVMKEIDKVRMQLKIAKDEEILQAAIDSGMFNEASRRLSLAQILISQANNIIQEVQDIFTEHKIKSDPIMDAAKDYMKAADKYFKEFSHLVDDNDRKMAMFKDLDRFHEIIMEFGGFEKVKSLMGGCKKAGQASLAKVRMCKGCKLAYNPDTLICKQCANSFCKGFEKGARWLENKRVERITNK